ncbi:MAG: hypothetical protein WDO15_08715 [Bacteroidota bacterium]
MFGTKGALCYRTIVLSLGKLHAQSLELLLFRSAEGLSVLPAHKVSSFRYYDEKENINRMFMSVASRYYERVVYGRLSVAEDPKDVSPGAQ